MVLLVIGVVAWLGSGWIGWRLTENYFWHKWPALRPSSGREFTRLMWLLGPFELLATLLFVTGWRWQYAKDWSR